MIRVGRGYQRPQPGTLAIFSPNATVQNGASTNPRPLYIPPDGKNLYVGNQSSPSGPTQIMQYDRNPSTGEITPMSTPSITSVYGPGFLTGDRGGLNVYSANGGGDYVATFVRNQTTGELSPGVSQYLATGVYPNGICMSPDDKFVYVSLKNPGGSGGISIYSRSLSGTGNAVGKLTFVTTYNTGANDQLMGIAISENGNHLYVNCMATNKVYQFSRDTTTGLLTLLSPASVPAGNFTAAMYITKEADSKHLYVANDGGATIGGYTRDDVTGLLTPMSPATWVGGNGPWSVVVTPDGTSLYCAGSDGQHITQYTRNVTTGLLTAKVPLYVRSDPTITAITGSGGPQNLLIGPEGRHLYCTNSVPTPSISQFNINQ